MKVNQSVETLKDCLMEHATAIREQNNWIEHHPFHIEEIEKRKRIIEEEREHIQIITFLQDVKDVFSR